MVYQYNHSRYSPAAPVVRVTVRNPADSTKQVTTDVLVDTGADITCIPKALIKVIGGEPASAYSVFGINEVSLGFVDSYFLEFEIASAKKLVEVLAIGDEPIVGRNLINEFIVELDGPAQKLSITSGIK